MELEDILWNISYYLSKIFKIIGKICVAIGKGVGYAAVAIFKGIVFVFKVIITIVLFVFQFCLSHPILAFLIGIVILSVIYTFLNPEALAEASAITE